MPENSATDAQKWRNGVIGGVVVLFLMFLPVMLGFRAKDTRPSPERVAEVRSLLEQQGCALTVQDSGAVYVTVTPSLAMELSDRAKGDTMAREVQHSLGSKPLVRVMDSSGATLGYASP